MARLPGDDEDFAKQFSDLGPTQLAQLHNTSVRAVYTRRRRAEARLGRPISAPEIELQPHAPMPSGPAMLRLTIENGCVLVISDAHYLPGHVSTAHMGFLYLCRKLKPRAVVQNGDVLDGGRISRWGIGQWLDYEHIPSVADEIRACQERLAEIDQAAKGARRIWTLGNHDCLDAQTELLTRRGWVKHDAIAPDDQVLSCDAGGISWGPIDEVVRYPFDGDLVRIESPRISMALTPNHRVVGRQLNWRTRRHDRFGYWRADDLPYSLDIPVSGQVEREDCPLTDDQLKLAGWLLTDGSEQKYNMSIYQSKPQGVAEIGALLDRMGVAHSCYSRNRPRRAVCGRELVADPLESHQFLIHAADTASIRAWLPNTSDMPIWAANLSGRQFGVFLDAIVAGDGVWDGAEDGRCAVVYGRRPFLDALQACAAEHGWRARVATDTRGGHRLCLAKRPNYRVERPSFYREHYRGTVWCLRVPPGNFMVRRNGAAYFTGNSRFETRLIASSPEFAGVHGTSLKDHFPDWEPCWAVSVNEDAIIKHRFKGGMYAPANNALWSGRTMVTGHLHAQQVMQITDYNGTRWGVDTGTGAEPYGPQFVHYTEANPVNWRSGFAVLTFVDGELLMPELVRVVKTGVIEFRGERIKVADPAKAGFGCSNTGLGASRSTPTSSKTSGSRPRRTGVKRNGTR